MFLVVVLTVFFVLRRLLNYVLASMHLQLCSVQGQIFEEKLLKSVSKKKKISFSLSLYPLMLLFTLFSLKLSH